MSLAYSDGARWSSARLQFVLSGLKELNRVNFRISSFTIFFEAVSITSGNPSSIASPIVGFRSSEIIRDSFIRNLDRRLKDEEGDPRFGSQWSQILSVAIRCANAVNIKGFLGPDVISPQWFYVTGANGGQRPGTLARVVTKTMADCESNERVVFPDEVEQTESEEKTTEETKAEEAEVEEEPVEVQKVSVTTRNMIQAPGNCPSGQQMDSNGVCREVF
ncbi:hypothetical protein EVAR_27232_1 [Eumeta japonica]|uniref:Uncharacterized protein n=1 Tax=Eumeta variegata TaxID=151549 RepID=A0A4C1VXC1_EUMVA|nr:hypothetical protein EVAR_27232_1 [Eumeta japonica]